MREFQISVTVKAVSDNELDSADRLLVGEAREATRRAYAPYSHFSVGAAIRLTNGEIVTGSNQENAAFPSGTCAERTAAFYAHSRYPDATFEAIAIAAIGTDGKPVTAPVAPCGACRQSLLEFETLAGHDVRVLLVGADSVYVFPSVKSLLPLSFSEF
ncbi:MAG: cytidine deaminase [Pseudoflavonifractor sp.]|nr:cytidine deaminase [Pseudoflavonifractor sp.]